MAEVELGQLRSIGCRVAQGYLFGGAVPPEASIYVSQAADPLARLMKPARSWSEIVHGVAGGMVAWSD